jgi:hypothetical protein
MIFQIYFIGKKINSMLHINFAVASVEPLAGGVATCGKGGEGWKFI